MRYLAYIHQCYDEVGSFYVEATDETAALAAADAEIAGCPEWHIGAIFPSPE